MSETERNKETIRRMLEAADRGNMAEIASCYAPDFEDHCDGGSRSGEDRRSALETFRGLLPAFSGLRHTIHDIIGEGDKVVARISATATHEGTFRGLAGSGRRVTVRQTVTYRFRDGLIAERWVDNPVSVADELLKEDSAAGEEGYARRPDRRHPTVLRGAAVDWRPDAAGGVYWELALRAVSLTCFRLDPGTRFPAHSHPSEQITLVLEGRLTFELQRERHALGPGDAIAIPSGIEHGATAGSEAVVAIDAWSPPPDHLGSG